MTLKMLAFINRRIHSHFPCMFTFSGNVIILGKISPLTYIIIISGFQSFHYGEMKHVIAKNCKLRTDFQTRVDRT